MLWLSVGTLVAAAVIALTTYAYFDRQRRNGPRAPAPPLTWASEKEQLEVEKLRAETSTLGTASSIVWPMLVSGMTAIVAVGGVGLSVYTFSQQHSYQEQQDARQRDYQKQQDAQQRNYQEHQDATKALQTALDMATDGKGGVDRRLAGIMQLRRFWDDPANESVLTSTFAAILLLPDSVDNASLARCAASDAIEAAIQTNPVPNPKRDARIAQLLYGDKKGARGLISQQNWLMTRRLSATGKTVANDSALATIECDSPLAATRQAIRKNWKHLRNVNLQGTDLSFTQLYEADIAGSLLVSTRLHRTNLHCANLFGVRISGFNPADSPDVVLTNVAGIGNDGTAFVQYARAHHAIQIKDTDWKTWSKSGFSGAVLARITSRPTPIAESDVAKTCSRVNLQTREAAPRSRPEANRVPRPQ